MKKRFSWIYTLNSHLWHEQYGFVERLLSWLVGQQNAYKALMKNINVTPFVNQMDNVILFDNRN